MRWVLLLAAMIAACSAPRRGTPSVETLVAATRNIDVQKDKSIESLVLNASATQPWMDLELRWLAPDRFDLLLRDRLDGTPMLFCSDHDVLVYSPAEGRLYHCDHAAGGFVNSLAENKGLTFGVSLGGALEDSEAGARRQPIRLALRDLLDAVEGPREMVPLGDQRYELRATSKRGSEFVFRFDLNREYPCVGYRLRGYEGSGLDLDVYSLLVNERLSDSNFRAFDYESIEKEFPVEKFDLAVEYSENSVSFGGFQEQFESVMNRVIESISLRRGLYGGEWRDYLQEDREDPIPWDEIKKNDKEMAPRLRALFAEKEE